MTDPTKPGYKTSEMWVTVFAMLLTFLAAKGVISVNDVDPLIKAVTAIYTGAVALVTIFAIVRAYINSRTTIKTTMLQNPPTQTPALIP